MVATNSARESAEFPFFDNIFSAFWGVSGSAIGMSVDRTDGEILIPVERGGFIRAAVKQSPERINRAVQNIYHAYRLGREWRDWVRVMMATKRQVLQAWDHWATTHVAPALQLRTNDAFHFFAYLQRERSHLFELGGTGDHRQVVLGWLLQERKVLD
jgi:hypothetical protein